MPSPVTPYRLREVFDEAGPWILTSYVEKSDGSALLVDSIESWSVNVYDAQSVSEDVAVWSLLAQSPSASNDDGSAIWPETVVVNGLSPTPRGHTVALQLDPRDWTAKGGRSYTVQVSASLDEAAGGGVIVIRASGLCRSSL
jgi:hypothetical protein